MYTPEITINIKPKTQNGTALEVPSVLEGIY